MSNLFPCTDFKESILTCSTILRRATAKRIIKTSARRLPFTPSTCNVAIKLRTQVPVYKNLGSTMDHEPQLDTWGLLKHLTVFCSVSGIFGSEHESGPRGPWRQAVSQEHSAHVGLTEIWGSGV